MNGFPGWQAVLRSCPDKSSRGDMILFANSMLDLEQGGGMINIPIVPVPEVVFYDEEEMLDRVCGKENGVIDE